MIKWKKNYYLLSNFDKLKQLNIWNDNKFINPINNSIIKKINSVYKFFLNEYENAHYTEEDLKVFYTTSKKNENDKINKKREILLKYLINNNLNPNKHEYIELKKNINKELKKYCIEEYTNIVCELKAGRTHNYDYDIIYYNKTSIIKKIKLEFKYGADKIISCPQFLSMYCSTINIFKTKDYIKYYYDNIDNFISSFPDDISVKLIDNKPVYSKYLKILNDGKHKHLFQNIIYKYSKETNNKSSFKIYINQQINIFLKDLKIEDLKFDIIKEMILEKQKDKVFLFIKNGNITSEIINDKITITNTFIIKNNNTIRFNTTATNYYIELLLRWKNHKGCAGPAWQISLKFNK